MGRNSPLPSSSSNEEQRKEIGDGGRLDLLVKALQQDEETEKSKPSEGMNEEKMAGLGGEDVGTEGSQVQDRNLILELEGGLGSGENMDQECGLASDQERKFKEEEGLVAGGTSKECSREKEEGEECEEGDQSDEHIERLMKVLIQLDNLKSDIRQTSLESSRLEGEMLKVYGGSRISDLDNKIKQLEEVEYKHFTEELKINGKGLEVKAREEGNRTVLKEEKIKKQKSEIDNSLDLLSKELEEEQLKLNRLNDNVKDIELAIWTNDDIEVESKNQDMAVVSSEDEAGSEPKRSNRLVPALLGSTVSIIAALILLKFFKRGLRK